jgi:hypothetical protein
VISDQLSVRGGRAEFGGIGAVILNRFVINPRTVNGHSGVSQRKFKIAGWVSATRGETHCADFLAVCPVARMLANQ